MVTKDQARQIVSVNLQKAMADAEKAQADIARAIQRCDEELQAARQRVSRYVNGTSDITGDDLANICEYLDISADWLLSNHGRKKSRRAS